eukprot:Skav226698  [mRNA]  locus=scaffold3971:211650:212303:- [translate_table: standard]
MALASRISRSFGPRFLSRGFAAAAKPQTFAIYRYDPDQQAKPFLQERILLLRHSHHSFIWMILCARSSSKSLWRPGV